MTTTTALTKMPLRQMTSVEQLFTSEIARQRLANVASNNLTPTRLLGLLANAVRKTPTLGKCSPISLLGALMVSAELGLEPNTPLGLAYLVPYKDGVASKKAGQDVYDVQLIIGYKGYADLAWRSGIVTYMHADVHYSDDELWEYEYGSEAVLRHRPGPKQGERQHAYFHIKVDAGDGRSGQAYVVLPWAEILKTRDASQGYRSAVQYGKKESSPWHAHLDRMACKTAIRRLAQSGEMPLSIERLTQALSLDETRVDYARVATGPAEGESIIEGAIVSAGIAEEDEDGEVVDEDDKPTPAAAEKPASTRQKKAASKKGTAAAQSGPQSAKSNARSPSPEKDTPATEPPSEASDDGTAGDTAADVAADALPDHLATVLDRVLVDLNEARNGGEIDATLELFKTEIDAIRECSSEAGTQLDDAETAARERVA